MSARKSDCERWIATRMASIEASGIRRVFELGRSLSDPVDLSIGQPDFDVPTPIKEAAHQAIDRGANGYTVTQGISALVSKIQADVDRKYPHAHRRVFLTSGTSGGLLLALSCTIEPGDEVIVFDPYFVAYPHLIRLVGGTPVIVDTYPDFQIDPDRVRAVLSRRTKAIIVNSPANPSGAVCRPELLREVAVLARERGILLISDEVYRVFCYDEAFRSPAEFNDEVVVLDGFSKAYGMTGWRLGFAHGPARLMEEMIKLQQFTYVCAPSMVQHAGIAAWDFDVSGIVETYLRKRDRMLTALAEHFEIVKPGGAFYIFPAVPWGTATEFAEEAVRESLLVIPGKTFSERDTHFRISYAAADHTIERGIDILRKLARRGKLAQV